MDKILKIKIHLLTNFASGFSDSKSCLGPESWPRHHSTVVDTQGLMFLSKGWIKNTEDGH